MIYLYPLTSLNLPNRLLIRLISLLHQILQHSQLHTDWGKRSRLWHPSSDRRSLIFKVSSVLVYCLLLGAVLFLWLTVRQQQIQLTTLDAAFRSGQLQTLPDRMQAIEDRQQQFVPKLQGENGSSG
ncbi:hypothetical protein MYA98_12170 [Salmonella sp. WGH-01]|nr:hypothetical protein MYA98_12170 [Salmonella sp. WGH-01]